MQVGRKWPQHFSIKWPIQTTSARYRLELNLPHESIPKSSPSCKNSELTSAWHDRSGSRPSLHQEPRYLSPWDAANLVRSFRGFVAMIGHFQIQRVNRSRVCEKYAT